MTAVAEAPARSAFSNLVGDRQVTKQQDPHAFRYGYMPGVWAAKSDPRKTGWALFPQGALIGFRTFPAGGHFDYNAGINGEKPLHNKVVEITAEMAMFNARVDMLEQEQIDNGFSAFDCLIGDPLAQNYFDAIHPDFDALGHKCPKGLEVCPTCRLDLLPTASTLAAFIGVYEKSSNVKLDLDVAEQVLAAITDSCQRFATYAAEAWRELADAKDRSRNSPQPFVLSPSHYHYKNVVHENTAEEIAERRDAMLSATIANGNKGEGSDLAEMKRMYADLAETARMQAGEIQGLKMRIGKQKTEEKENGEV